MSYRTPLKFKGSNTYLCQSTPICEAPGLMFHVCLCHCPVLSPPSRSRRMAALPESGSSGHFLLIREALLSTVPPPSRVCSGQGIEINWKFDAIHRFWDLFVNWYCMINRIQLNRAAEGRDTRQRHYCIGWKDEMHVYDLKMLQQQKYRILVIVVWPAC